MTRGFWHLDSQLMIFLLQLDLHAKRSSQLKCTLFATFDLRPTTIITCRHSSRSSPFVIPLPSEPPWHNISGCICRSVSNAGNQTSKAAFAFTETSQPNI
ncbi:unnamed protein product [Musa textilis]